MSERREGKREREAERERESDRTKVDQDRQTKIERPSTKEI